MDTEVRNEPLRWDASGSTTGGAGTKVVFRYRADELDSATGSVSGTNVAPVRKYPATLAVTTVPRPRPFRDFKYVSLDGTTRAILGTSAIQTQTSLGFTVQVWFRADTATQTAKLFSTTESYRGFALSYDNGLLRGTYSYRKAGDGATATSANRHTVTQDLTTVRADDGKWHVATFAVTRIPETTPKQVQARLYLDGKQVTTRSDVVYQPVDQDFTFWDSNSYPAVGAEPDGNAPTSGFFDGDINAAVVYNYPVDHNVLALSPPWDGDMLYGGQPSYWDYLVATEEAPTTSTQGTWSYAHHVTNSERNGVWASDINTARARVPIPLISASYVPQGLSLSEDGRTMYQFFYYSTKDPTVAGQNPVGLVCGAGKRCPAYAVTRTDLDTLRVTGIYLLDLPGDHAGGIVALGQYVYVGALGALDASGNPDYKVGQTIFRFDLATGQTVSSGNPTHGLPPIYRVSTPKLYDWSAAVGGLNASTSAMAYSPVTRSIYTLGYLDGTDDATANTIYQFPVDTNGDVTTTSPRKYALPAGPVNTRGQNQGMTPIVSSDGRTCFLLAHEYKTSPSPTYSQIVRACFTSAGAFDDWVPRKTLPGVAENLAVGPDNTVWVLNENPAIRHQRRASDNWYRTFTPYVAGFPLSDLN
jgi:hypothetical protein